MREGIAGQLSRVRLLLSSNMMGISSGYGGPSTALMPRLAELPEIGGRQNVAQLAWHGLESQVIHLDGFRIYPKGKEPYGNDIIGHHTRDFGANWVVTLIDTWVLSRTAEEVKPALWTPYLPIDMTMPAQRILDGLEGAFLPLVFSKWGVAELKRVGVESMYIPLGCFDYDAAVTVEPGRTERLGDIVTGKVTVDSVIGVDDQGNPCRAQILGRLTRPLTDSHALAITTETGRRMIITRDNEVMTPRGWIHAGDLTYMDYVRTMNVTHVSGGQHEATLHACRPGLVESELPNSLKRGNSQQVPWQHLVGNQPICQSQVEGDAYCQSSLYENRHSQAPPYGDGIGIHRGDHRWRGAHIADQGEEEEAMAVCPSHRSDESVQSVDRVAFGTNPLDFAQGRGATHERAGGNGETIFELDISPSHNGTGRDGTAGIDIALSSDQEGTSRDRYQVLQVAGQEEHKCAPGGRRERFARRDYGAERTEVGSYERIVSIVPVSLKTVYDLTTSTGNFLVSGIVVHNCEPSVFRILPDDEVAHFKATAMQGAQHLTVMVAANQAFPSRKAFEVNIPAWAAFAKDKPGAKLYLHTNPSVSDGGLDIVALVQELGILDKVMFPSRYQYKMGYPAQFLALVYNAADVLMAASRGEGFGIPIIEAQACGCPVVTTNFSSMPELVRWGHAVGYVAMDRTYLNAWQVIPDEAEIVQRLGELYAEWEADGRQKNPDKRAETQDKIHAEYSWDVIVRDYWRPLARRMAKEAPELDERFRVAVPRMAEPPEIRQPQLNGNGLHKLGVTKVEVTA